jgi:hypothetical protein
MSEKQPSRSSGKHIFKRDHAQEENISRFGEGYIMFWRRMHHGLERGTVLAHGNRKTRTTPIERKLRSNADKTELY